MSPKETPLEPFAWLVGPQTSRVDDRIDPELNCKPLFAYQELSRGRNPLLVRRAGGIAISLSSPTGRPVRGDGDPAERAAHGRPKACSKVPAPAGLEGDEPRQPDPELPQVHH